MKARSALVEIILNRAQRSMEQLARSKGQLISLRRRSRLPGSAAIQTLACAPCPGPLLVEVVGHPCSQCAGARFVGRNEALAGGFDKLGLNDIEEQVHRLLRRGTR